MEAAFSNLTSPGDKVVVLTAGKFGERWRDLAKAFHCQIELVSVPYGETFDLRRSRLEARRRHASFICRRPRPLPARAMT